MRKRILILAMLCACGIDLAWTPPANAFDEIVYDVNHSKKMRRKRNLYTLAIGGCVVAGVFVFVILNAIDRTKTRQRLERQKLARQQNGLA